MEPIARPSPHQALSEPNGREVYTSSISHQEEDRRVFDRLKDLEQNKNELIENLMRRVEVLNEALRDEILARQDEQQDHYVQLQQLQYGTTVYGSQSLQSETEVNVYVALVIDGDSFMFKDILLALGEDGGKHAASILLSAVQEQLPLNHQVVVKIFANVKAIAQRQHYIETITSNTIIWDFIGGFNGNVANFDFIDVGTGAHEANKKSQAASSLYLGDPNCLQVILCTKQRNELKNSARLKSKIRLLDIIVGDTMSCSMNNFETFKLKDIFVTTSAHELSANGRRYSDGKRLSATYSSGSVFSEPAGRKNSCSTPSQISARSPVTPIVPMVPVAVTPVETPKPMTWAKLASSPAPPKPSRPIAPLPPPKEMIREVEREIPPSSNSAISRNIHGDRIDQFYPTTASEWRRVQQLHLCNVHFLRRECHYGDKCTHAHNLDPELGGLPDGSLSRRDLEILSQVSRYAPCRNGTACDDVKCIFGHRCPVQENEGCGSSNGNDVGCRHGKQCKFPKEMHGVDIRVVKVVTI